MFRILITPVFCQVSVKWQAAARYFDRALAASVPDDLEVQPKQRHAASTPGCANKQPWKCRERGLGHGGGFTRGC